MEEEEEEERKSNHRSRERGRRQRKRIDRNKIIEVNKDGGVGGRIKPLEKRRMEGYQRRLK